jgi:Oligoketide cyclase/lipid transport protein
MPYVEVSLPVNAGRETIYPILKEMAKYPEFMSDLVSVDVLERAGNTTVTKWVSNVDGRVIRWTERDIFDDANYHIAYSQIDGDLKKFAGEWILTPLDAATTEIKLTADFEFGVPMIAGLLNPILKKKLKVNCENMLKAIKDRLEKP